MSTFVEPSYIKSKLKSFQRAKELGKTDYKKFWQQEAKRLSWQTDFHTVHNDKFIDAEWFLGGKINASINCLDRNIAKGLKDKTAIIYEDENQNLKKISYQKLWEMTCNIAAILHNNGIKAGDRVAIYMPTNPQSVASMLACARIGAIHTVVFAGFSKEALANRIHDAQAKAIITCNNTQRKGREINLRGIVDDALKSELTKSISFALCFGIKAKETIGEIDYLPYEEEKKDNWPKAVSSPKGFDSEHPLFILYTSGTTGKPKGIFHSTGGYLTQVVSTASWIFDFKPDDLFWCTADIGWITGHSYVTYGPLALGASIFLYDGAINWPTSSRIYELIEKHRVSILYTYSKDEQPGLNSLLFPCRLRMIL